jgi:Protein of unknown function (DUF2804)
MQSFYKQPLEASAIRIPGCRCIKILRSKKWEFIAIISKEFNASFLVNSQGPLKVAGICYLESKVGGKCIDYTAYANPLKAHVSNTSLVGSSSITTKSLSIKITNNYKQGYYTVEVNFDHAGNRVYANFNVRVVGDPLAHTSYLAKSKAIYQHHASNYFAEGIIRINNVEKTLNYENNVVTLDYTMGMYPISTRWKWVTGGGQQNGHRITFNIALICDKVVCGGIWVDNKLSYVKEVKFTVGKKDVELDGIMKGSIINTFTANQCKLIGYTYHSCEFSGHYQGIDFTNLPGIFENFNSYW